MNVSFSGNHLIITKDEKTRDMLKSIYRKDIKASGKLKHILSYGKNSVLVLDGKEETDFKNMLNLHIFTMDNFTSESDNHSFFSKKLIEGYAKKAIVVDLRDVTPKNFMANTINFYANQKSKNTNDISGKQNIIPLKNRKSPDKKLSILC